MYLFFSPFSTEFLSPAELINLPFIPKSCSSVQKVRHAPRKRERAAWLGNECSYSHTIIFCEMLDCKAERYRIHLILNKKPALSCYCFWYNGLCEFRMALWWKAGSMPENFNLCNQFLYFLFSTSPCPVCVCICVDGCFTYPHTRA